MGPGRRSGKASPKELRQEGGVGVKWVKRERHVSWTEKLAFAKGQGQEPTHWVRG